MNARVFDVLADRPQQDLSVVDDRIEFDFARVPFVFADDDRMFRRHLRRTVQIQRQLRPAVATRIAAPDSTYDGRTSTG